MNGRGILAMLAISLFCSGLASCGNGGSKTSSVPSLLRTDQFSGNAANSYEVFVPARTESNQTFPLLVILDPHGSGKTALAHFRLAAERYPVVLVASNLIKNNLPGFEGVIQSLIADVQAKYPVDKRVYMSGFSGGARMAVGYAMSHPLNGLILSGALAGSQELHQVGCMVYAISGTDDFNFMETAQYLFQEATTPTNLKIELTRSSHGWPDSLILADAFGFVRWATSANEADAVALKAFEKGQTVKIDSLRLKAAFIMARWTARNMTGTPPFNADQSFSTLDNQLKSSPGYADEMKRLLENLQMEVSVRDPYLKALETNDVTWWKNELVKVDGQIRTAKDPLTQDAYRRIKGFWGIACYSMCNKAVASGDFKSLRQYVSVYRILEPQNPDMLHFSELLVQGTGQAE